MAKTNVKKIGNAQRPVNVSRNDFTDANEYGVSNTISPIGRDPDSSGQIGTSLDIVQRNNTLAKNPYQKGKPYTISDTE